GALELAFQQLRLKLEREGLFSRDRKRELPRYPKRIVLITSTQTAALQDMLKVLRRFPFLRLAVYHVPVQGDGAGPRIADALRHVNATVAARGTAHAVVLARGGGSLEDLWAFNHEAVARAIAESMLPVVTGIGHEVDVSIADLVADHHAHTPTEAAQVLVRHWRTAADEADAAAYRLDRAARQVVADARQRLAVVARHEAFRRPLDGVNLRRQNLDDAERQLLFAAERRASARRRRLDDVAARLEAVHPAKLVARGCGQVDALEARLLRAVAGRLKVSRDRLARADVRLAERSPRHVLQLFRQRLDLSAARFVRGTVEDLRRRRRELDFTGQTLDALSPEAVLRRGYSITTRAKDGRVIKAAADVRPGDKLLTRFADGEVRSTAEDARQLSLFE
ncbi:MAG TPA: exodeoxyribonuclease VII large subunit, partial [Tepidisphaeraceae bacterium]|nr:exodeoxyribonuclease VII large subunit [Tepidisphaeraceae bacterium]